MQEMTKPIFKRKPRLSSTTLQNFISLKSTDNLKNNFDSQSPEQISKTHQKGEHQLKESSYKQWFKSRCVNQAPSHYYSTNSEL
jgi:hypothetical protein